MKSLLIASLLLLPAIAYGAGTAAGTSVSNSASISFDVGGVAQTPISSAPSTFVVDRKVNLTIAVNDAGAVAVIPGASNNVLTFTLTNTGNAVQDFDLAAFAKNGGLGHFGGTDNKDGSNMRVFAESGATVGFQIAQDTAVYVDELAADASIKVYVVVDFAAAGYTNGDVASYHIVAQTRAGGGASSLGAALTETAGADTVGSVDTVFADAQGSYTSGDAARDAKFSADDDFVITAASITVSKASAVFSDPVNGTTNPKAIPGAIIEYTITVANGASSSTASNIVVSDSLDTEIGAGSIAFAADGTGAGAYASGKGVVVTSPGINGGSPLALSNSSGDDQGDWNVTAPNTVTVSSISLTAGQSATVKFCVQIQ